ncbi:MAG: GHKL domain-containing protein [Pseudomonadales bacterium]|nr:GHKL domain-containing protein [Pseudomonadales bacterium]
MPSVLPPLFHKQSSLRNRLLVTASLVLFIFLGLMGLVFDRAFQKSAENSIAERLKIQIYGLLSVTEFDSLELTLPEILQEPRFNNPGSDLFALVLDDMGIEQWRSPSSVDLALEDLGLFHQELAPGEERFGRVSVTADTYFYLSYKILWLGSGEVATPFTFVVIQTSEAYYREITSYRNNLWGWLVGVILILIGVQAAVMKWGLAPLGELASDLKAIEDGRQAFLDGEYPEEIEGVTKNLNLLLASERAQRERYRTTMADLAHSLKTPLAILKGSANQLEYQGASKAIEIQNTIDEQVARMDEIIGYQLERAVIDSSTLIKKSILVNPIVDRLIAAMEKVYAEKEVSVELNFQDCTFFGDERDLMEVLGNIIDNAYKYCDKRVRVDLGRGKGIDMKVIVEDDGSGIEEMHRTKMLNRGSRLDSHEAGQGIGLAVVVEIVNRYGGEIKIEDSILGGAKVSVSFG